MTTRKLTLDEAIEQAAEGMAATASAWEIYQCGQATSAEYIARVSALMVRL